MMWWEQAVSSSSAPAPIIAPRRRDVCNEKKRDKAGKGMLFGFYAAAKPAMWSKCTLSDVELRESKERLTKRSQPENAGEQGRSFWEGALERVERQVPLQGSAGSRQGAGRVFCGPAWRGFQVPVLGLRRNLAGLARRPCPAALAPEALMEVSSRYRSPKR